MQLMRQSVEAWQNEELYSIGNNTSENPIPGQEIFKPVDHVKYEGQVRSDRNICFLCRVLVELSSCRVTYENCYKKFQPFRVKELLVYNRIEAFFKNFHQKWKMHHVELNSGTSKSSKVHSLSSGKVAATPILKSVPSQFSPFIL